MEGGESPAEPGSGPARRFPVAAVEEILRDVVGSALRERRYEPGPCRAAAKDIAEVVKARVKALVVPRCKAETRTVVSWEEILHVLMTKSLTHCKHCEMQTT
ncbi:dynein light chain Tctex-type 5 isoform X2 [Pyrgilauda ruficollis]|uniref:dynein light chain Tctex-type 5 isoform X2 n=1 Tax=Pyrgilauda ruficollis TaxID=221976 RepID=UPI001B866F47|nr:dynein light chain Tctex-type 5 isoform X2 [Pyrgilauda ruficollis]